MTIQIAEVSLDTTASTSGNVFRVVDVWLDVATTADGNPPVLSGTVTPSAVVVAGTQVTLNVTNTGGESTSTSWTVEAISPSVELASAATSATFTAPYLSDQADVLVDVTATGPGGTSDVLTLAVTVLPHLSWYMDAASNWRPVTAQVML